VRYSHYLPPQQLYHTTIGRTIQQQQPHAQQQHTKKNMHTHNHHPRESFEVNEEVAGKETKEQMTTLFTRNDKYGQR
jgi:hypothetical protein